MKETISKYIPEGKENAVSIWTLCKATGTGSDDVKAAILAARMGGADIRRDEDGGYWKARTAK